MLIMPEDSTDRPATRLRPCVLTCRMFMAPRPPACAALGRPIALIVPSPRKTFPAVLIRHPAPRRGLVEPDSGHTPRTYLACRRTAHRPRVHSSPTVGKFLAYNGHGWPVGSSTLRCALVEPGGPRGLLARLGGAA